MRKIIVQEQQLDSSDFSINFVFWLSVLPGREIIYKNKLFKESVVKDATQEEIDSIANGFVFELQGTMNVPKGSSFASIKRDLEEKYASEQTSLNNKNKGRFYGIYFDGTSWNGGGID